MNGDVMSVEHAALRSEVQRKMGRNLLVFQQIELLLKYLAEHSSVQGDPESIEATQAKWAQRVRQKMTMGKLVEHYTDTILVDAGEPPSEQPNVDKWWVSFKFTSTGSVESNAQITADLQILVNERNDLVHHFLPRWTPEAFETLQAAEQYLDAQREKVLPIFYHLRSEVQQLQAEGAALAEAHASGEYQQTLELLWLQASPLVSLLREVVARNARPGGWAYLADAGNIARSQLPDHVQNMAERYGYSTLKKLLLGAEVFDVMDEPLPNGGFRTVYRVKACAVLPEADGADKD